MYYIIYMSTIKLRDIIKNDQIGGAPDVKLDIALAPEVTAVTTTSDLNYIVVWFSEAIAQPDSSIKIQVDAGDQKNKDAAFHSYYGPVAPFKALQFSMPSEIKTVLTSNPQTRFKAKFNGNLDRSDDTQNKDITTLNKVGFISTASFGILNKFQKTGNAISMVNPAGVQRLQSVTEKTLSNEEKAAIKAKQLQASLKPTFVEKASTQRKFKEGDVLWNDKTGYTDYLNMTDLGDKMEQKGRIFLDTGVEYQKFIDSILPRLPKKAITPDGPVPMEEVKKKMGQIKDTDVQLNKFIKEIIEIYGDDNRASRKYLIKLKFELYKLQINGMRVLIKKYVDDADDLQGKLDKLLEVVQEKVKLMNEVLEMTAAKKSDGGLTRPEVIEKMNELIASYQGADSYRYEEAVRTFQQEPSVLDSAQTGGGIYREFSETISQENFQNDYLGLQSHLEDEYDDDYFSYYEKLTNQISNSLEMTGGRSLTTKEKIAKDYLTFIKLINAQYALLKSEIMVKTLFLLNYAIPPVTGGPTEWEVPSDFKIDSQLGTKLKNLAKNLFVNITDIFKLEADPASGGFIDSRLFIQLSKQYKGGALSFMEQAELNTELCNQALGMTAPLDANAVYSKDDQRNDRSLQQFIIENKPSGVFYFSPNLFKMLKKISPSLLMQEYEKEDSILKKIITETYLNFKKILDDYNMDTGIIQPDFVKVINGKYKEILAKNKVVYTYIRIRTDKGSKNPRFEIKPTESQYITEDQNLLEITERVIPTTLPNLKDSQATLEEYLSITNDEKPELVSEKTKYYFGPFDGFYDNASSAELGAGIYNDVKEKMWRGDNFCIFGYGQSGSGKTTSLIYADYDGLKPDERDGMVIEMLKHPDILHNYSKIQLEMTNIYTSYPADARKGGKKRFFVSPMNLELADMAATSIDQAGGGQNPSNVYRKLVEEYGNEYEYWTDEKGVEDLQNLNQIGGAPTAATVSSVIGYDAAADEANVGPDGKTKAPYGYPMSDATFEKFSPVAPKDATTLDAKRKPFVKEFKWDEANGTWVVGDLPIGKTPGHHEKLGGIISKNFELGREIESTTNNPQSSRSHVVLCLTVWVKNSDTKADGDTGTYPDLRALDYSPDKKRDPKSKSVPIPKDVSSFKLMVCDLAGAENKFKCTGFKNDIEKFYNIYIPKDITNKGSLKYAYPPMYDLYRCKTSREINPTGTNPDSKLIEITKRIQKLALEYQDLRDGKGTDAQNQDSKLMLVGSDPENIFDTGDITGTLSLGDAKFDLGLEADNKNMKDYDNYVDGVANATNPISGKNGANLDKAGDLASIGAWWGNQATGKNDLGKDYQKQTLKKFLRSWNSTNKPGKLPNVGAMTDFGDVFNCDIPAYVSLQKTDAEVAGVNNSAIKLQEAKVWNLGDPKTDEGLDAYENVFGNYKENHRFDYEDPAWNEELDGFRKSFVDMKKLAPFWKTITSDIEQADAINPNDPTTPEKNTVKNLDDFEAWITFVFCYGRIVGQIPLRAIRELGENETNTTTAKQIKDGTADKALAACTTAVEYARAKNPIETDYDKPLKGAPATLNDPKFPSSNKKDTFYIYEFLGSDFKDPTLKDTEITEIESKIKENNLNDILASANEITESYKKKIYDFVIDPDNSKRVNKLINKIDENYPNTNDLHYAYTTMTQQYAASKNNLFLMKYNAFWLKYYPMFERRIQNLVKSKPLVAKNPDAQKRLLAISEDFASLFIFLMIYQGNKPGTNAQNEDAPNALKADDPDFRQQNTMKDNDSFNDEHYLYYNKAARDNGALGYENNIMFTSPNDSWELIEQMKQIMRSIVSLILGFVPPSPYKIQNKAKTGMIGGGYSYLKQIGLIANKFAICIPQSITADGIMTKFLDQRSKIWAHLVLSRLYFNCDTRVDEGQFINFSLRDMALQIRDMIILVNNLKPIYTYWDALYHPFCYNLNLTSDDVFDRPAPDGSVDSVIVDIIRRYAGMGSLVLKYDAGEDQRVKEANQYYLSKGNTKEAGEGPRYLTDSKDTTDKYWYKNKDIDTLPVNKFAFIVFTVINTTLWSVVGAPVNNPPTPPYMNLAPIKFYESQGNKSKLVKEVVTLIQNARKNYYYSKLPEIQPDVLFIDAINEKNVMKYYKKMLELFDANNASTLFGTLETTEMLQKLNMKYMCYSSDDKTQLLKDYAQDLDAPTTDFDGDFRVEKKYNVKPNLETLKIQGGKDYNVDYDV